MHVLFVGNSMTRYHEMPALFAARLRAAKPNADVHVSALAPDGESLAGHLASPMLATLLEERPWDYIVVQERTSSSTWSLNGAVQYEPPDRYLQDVGAFAQLARTNGATLVLYQIWSPGAPPDAFVYNDYPTVEAARTHRAVLAPVGRVWSALRSKGLAMTAADKIHPTPLGSSAAAAMIAAAIVGESALVEPALSEPALSEPALSEPPSARDASSKREPTEITPISTDAAVADETAVADAVRAVLAQRDATLAFPAVPRPPYRAKPVAGVSDAPLRSRLAGVWRARDGGTRLSHGTEVEVAIDDGVCRVRVREFAATAAIEPKATVSVCDDARIEIEFVSNSVAFRWSGWLENGALSVLTVQGFGQAREQYRTVRYRKNGEAKHFAGLRALFAQLDAHRRRESLAAALPAHYARLTALLGEGRVREDRQGFPIGEWDAILTARHYERLGDAGTALTYYAAGVEMSPRSVDTRQTYADALRGAGRRGEAAEHYRAALALLGASAADASRRAAIEAALRDIGP